MWPICCSFCGHVCISIWGVSEVWVVAPAVSSRKLGWFWHQKNGTWDPFLLINYLSEDGSVEWHLAPMETSVWKTRSSVRQVTGLWHPFGLLFLTHMEYFDYLEIYIKYSILELGIRGHSVVLNPGKLIHLVIPFGQKCGKWYLSRF